MFKIFTIKTQEPNEIKPAIITNIGSEINKIVLAERIPITIVTLKEIISKISVIGFLIESIGCWVNKHN